jgi:hypothetical protein
MQGQGIEAVAGAAVAVFLLAQQVALQFSHHEVVVNQQDVMFVRHYRRQGVLDRAGLADHLDPGLFHQHPGQIDAGPARSRRRSVPVA